MRTMSQLTDVGPRRISLITFLTKTAAGISGGLMGTMILLLIFFGASSTFTMLSQNGFSEITPIFIFLFVALVFLGSMGANLAGSLFIGLVDKEKYHRLSSAVMQIFVVNLLVFIILVPLYLVMGTINPNVIIFLAALQVVLTTAASFLILEIISDTTYALLGVYTSIFGSLGAILIALSIFHITHYNATILLLIVLPLLWGMFGFFSSVLEILYYFLFEFYGIDFLRSDTAYGRDVQFEKEDNAVSQEDEKMLLKEKMEEEGVEFLRKRQR